MDSGMFSKQWTETYPGDPLSKEQVHQTSLLSVAQQLNLPPSLNRCLLALSCQRVPPLPLFAGRSWHDFPFFVARYAMHI